MSSAICSGYSAPPPRKGVCGGANIFVSDLLQPAQRTVFAYASSAFSLVVVLVSDWWSRSLSLLSLNHVWTSSSARYVLTTSTLPHGISCISFCHHQSQGLQWSSGSMPDCSAWGPGIESHCGQLCLSHNHCDLQPWARAVCTFPAVPRSTRHSIPSVGR